MRIKILAILIALVLPSEALAALFFGAATSDRVVMPTGAAINNLETVTYYGWFYHTQNSDLRRWFRKDTSPQSGNFKGLRTISLTKLNWTVVRATTNAEALTATGVLEVNKWLFIAVTFNSTDGPKVYKGTLTTPVAEVAYDVGYPQLGTGAIASDGNTLAIGNEQGATQAMVGRVAVFGAINRSLTLEELKILQFRPYPMSGTVGFWQLGYNGTGTQADWSGNMNNGTTTGVTVAPHVPLGMPFDYLEQDVYAKAPQNRFYAFVKESTQRVKMIIKSIFS